MSVQTIALTKINASNYFATLPFVTAQVNTKVFPSKEYFSINILTSDIASLFNLGDLFYPESYQTMIASERTLAKDWEQPDEDAAWANL